jgi:hypothetical protein
MKRKMEPFKKLWDYDPDDTTTWKYLGVRVKYVGRQRKYSGFIVNPEFKYKHLEENKNNRKRYEK